MKWYIFAILSSIIWGIHYTILEYSLTKISPYTILLITSLSTISLYFFFFQEINSDISTIFSMNFSNKWPILLLFFTSFGASMCLYTAISLKSATSAALIEITYPIWIIILSIFVFSSGISLYTLIGGLFILLGSGIIIFFK